MKVILGSDVDGNELKDYIKNYLLENKRNGSGRSFR